MFTKTCAVSGKSFTVRDEDQDFYQKIGVPEPKLCPAERMRRRLCWRNVQNLYSRRCDATQKSIISHHHESQPYPVYDNRYWWGDGWDPLSFGRDFDFSQSFFEQFKVLHNTVPQLAIMNDNGVSSENCLYCDDFAFGKDCYLVTGSWRVKNSMYCDNVNHGEDIFDCASVNLQCELCYECIDCQHIYNCIFLQQSSNCNDCAFGYDLIGCRDCFGCVGLRQKQYYIYNEPYDETGYKAMMEKIDRGSRTQIEKMKSYFEQHKKKYPLKAYNQKRCEDSRGDQLFGCKSCYECFDYFNGEHCAYSWQGDGGKYSHDFYQSGNPQWCYDNVTPDDSYQVHFSIFTWKSKDCLYCDNCHSCEDCFGCISLKRKKFCIFNKQYTEAEYTNLKARIIEHMGDDFGEFFPSHLSPFAYNESVAHEFYPLEKGEALSQGVGWRDEVIGSAREDKYDLPDNIKNVGDDVLRQVLFCEVSGKPYRLQKAELKFYQQMGLPIPSKCPKVRYVDRQRKKLQRLMCDRLCDNCDQKISSVYPKSFEGKVFCEDCYLRSV